MSETDREADPLTEFVRWVPVLITATIRYYQVKSVIESDIFPVMFRFTANDVETVDRRRRSFERYNLVAYVVGIVI